MSIFAKFIGVNSESQSKAYSMLSSKRSNLGTGIGKEGLESPRERPSRI
jgi:hypothetical protein